MVPKETLKKVEDKTLKRISKEGDKLIDIKDIKEEVEDTGKDVDEIKEDVEEIKEEIEDAGKDIDEIKEEVEDTGKDVDEIKEGVDEIKEDVEEIAKTQKSMFNKISSRLIPKEFNANDIAQQIVGAIILSSPLAVTSEVWELARELDTARLLIIIGITLLFDVLLIYYTSYRKEKEKKIINLIPARLFSMIVISYLTATTILYVFGVIGIHITDTEWALKLIVFVGLFANIGAGTADILK
ncbi:DUF2391 family protein [archaeon]|nr:DUF2391 family protein [archaeon]